MVNGTIAIEINCYTAVTKKEKLQGLQSDGKTFIYDI